MPSRFGNNIRNGTYPAEKKVRRVKFDRAVQSSGNVQNLGARK